MKYFNYFYHIIPNKYKGQCNTDSMICLYHWILWNLCFGDQEKLTHRHTCTVTVDKLNSTITCSGSWMGFILNNYHSWYTWSCSSRRHRFYQTRSAWSMDCSTENHSFVTNFTPAVTKNCEMWEDQAFPYVAKVCNCSCKMADSRALIFQVDPPSIDQADSVWLSCPRCKLWCDTLNLYWPVSTWWLHI